MDKMLKNELFKKIILQVNKILRQPSAAGAGMELLMKFPIEFKIIKVAKEFKANEDASKTEKAYAHFRAYTQKGIQWKLFIEFLQFKNEKEKEVEKYIKLLLNNEHLALVYLHEVQHIIRLHLTDAVESKMKAIIKKSGKNIPEEAQYALINVAEDYAINWAIKEIIDSPKEFFELGMYNEEYHNEKLNEYQILEKILIDNKLKIKTKKIKLQLQTQGGQCQCGQSQAQNEQCQSGQFQAQDGQNQEEQNQNDQSQNKQNNQDSQTEITITQIEYDGKTIYSDIEASKKASKNKNEKEKGKEISDSELADLAQQLGQTMKEALEKGNFPLNIKESLIPEVPVNVDWIEKLKKSLVNIVNYNAQDYYTNWRNLNNKLRHIAKFPQHQYIENKINLYLSIDQSGSMSDEDLGKLLFTIKKLKNKLNKLTVIIHDFSIAKVYESKDVPTIKELKQWVGTRIVAGGTSHKEVFEYLDKLKFDPEHRPIYISYSDNCSDIEEHWSKFKNKKNFAGLYFISPIDNPVKVPGAINITI